MKNLWFLRSIFALALICLGLSACSGSGSSAGGGGGGGTTYYTVTATAGNGTTISPTSMSVVAGQTASFTVGLQSGYQNLVATGCTISGATCTTGSVNSNMSVSTSATPIPTYSITGTVTGATGFSVTCGSVAATVTGSSFTCSGLANGTYIVTPILTGYTFSPTSTSVVVNGANATANFTATQIPMVTITLQLTGTTGTLANTSVAAGSTFSVTGVGLASGYQAPIVATGCTISGTTCTGTANGNITVTLTATAITPGIDWVEKSLRAVYDADLLATPICFQVQTHGSGFHVVVTRTDDIAGESVTLNDAGNNCDTTAGDGVFSGPLSMTSVPSTPASGGRIGFLLFSVSIVSNSTGVTLVSQPTQLRIANAVLRGTVKTTVSGAFTIAPNALFYNVSFATSQQDVAKAVYGIVKDTYDGLLISESKSNNSTGTGTQDYLPVRQPAVYGTGITSFFDVSTTYGSNGVLLGIIENDDGDATLRAFNHEAGLHLMECCYASDTVLPFSNSGPHINNGLFSFPDAVMGGGAAQYIVKQADGDWMVAVNTTATAGEISPLAKYFGRVITASSSEIPSQMCAAFGYKGTPMPGDIIPATSVTCFTIQDVIAQFGPVSPARTAPIIVNVLPVVRYEDGQMNDALVTSTSWIFAFEASTTACSADTNVPPLSCSFYGAMAGDATLNTSVSLK